MLRVNVGLSRKLTQDYNSTGFQVNIEGEVTAPPSDPEAVIEQVKQLYDLAEEALGQQIERSHSDAAFATRDEQNGNGHSASRRGETCRSNGRTADAPRENGRGEDSATNKQINYLLTIAKRQRLSTSELEGRIEEILEKPVELYSLTKRQAGLIIDHLSAATADR